MYQYCNLFLGYRNFLPPHFSGTYHQASLEESLCRLKLEWPSS